MTEKVIQYQNWSTQIFEGFYESNLYNSDAVFYLAESEPQAPDGYYYDICDFEGFEEEVAEKAVDLLWDCIDVDDKIILNMKYTGLSSPKYYNYSTDRIEADVTVDYENLKDYCLTKNRESFDSYLHENFTSYDGFWSFVANNVNQFESELESESERYDQVMVEYYLLQQFDVDGYRMDLWEYAQQYLWERLCLYCEKDGKYYDYTINEDEETVTIGNERN